MAEYEHFLAAEASAEIVDHFKGILLHPFDVHGGALNVFAVRGVGFASATLVPLNDSEVLFPGILESSGDGHEGRAGSAVNEQQNGILPRFAADFDPLADAADGDLLDAIDSVRRMNGALARDAGLGEIPV